MPTITIPQKIGRTSLRELRPFIVQTISDVLNDPDFGLELTERAKKRLNKVRHERNGPNFTLEDIKNELWAIGR